AQRGNAPVETFCARQGELLRRPVLAPADGLTAVVNQDAVRPSGLDERPLLRHVLDARGRTVRKHLAVEMATALVQHAGAECPPPARRKQALEVYPRLRSEFFRGVGYRHLASHPSVERPARRPQGEQRERSVRWRRMLASRPLLRSLEDLVGSRQQRLRDSYSEHLCGPEIAHEL